MFKMNDISSLKSQVQKLIYQISNQPNVPYSLVRTIENDVNNSSLKHDVDELKQIKSKLEKLVL